MQNACKGRERRKRRRKREGGYLAKVRWLLPWRRLCMMAKDGSAARWEQK